MFRKVLIANRAGIAVRIVQTLQEMGIKAVSIYSDPDKNSKHVLASDEAYSLNGISLEDTYLNIEKILNIAKQCGANAIHPGYGFLSENADFAKACIDSGINFIGPGPELIKSMGDKIEAKKIMKSVGVPVVPAFSLDEGNYSEIASNAEKVGYPLLVKAVSGGGGRGMRFVENSLELQHAIDSASREAKNSFGDGRVFVEKYIENPRHIEFQIFGDNYENIIHLFERECSIQRRYQKIIEESPSVALSPELRTKMGQAAVKAAKAIGYKNAGTVEFLLDKNNNFYFLEVNTRLQVEHSVTEAVIHGDLVRAQILVAMGEKLQLVQNNITQDGHSIECRIYAEDPLNNFLPSCGKLCVYREPVGFWIRVDSGVQEGTEVTMHYDPMIAKLIVWAKTRNAAIDKMLWALSNYPVLGIKTNIQYLYGVISHKDFREGNYDTGFLNKNPVEELIHKQNDFSLGLVVSALVLDKMQDLPESGFIESEIINNDPWLTAGSWRLV